MSTRFDSRSEAYHAYYYFSVMDNCGECLCSANVDRCDGAKYCKYCVDFRQR